MSELSLLETEKVTWHYAFCSTRHQSGEFHDWEQLRSVVSPATGASIDKMSSSTTEQWRSSDVFTCAHRLCRELVIDTGSCAREEQSRCNFHLRTAIHGRSIIKTKLSLQNSRCPYFRISPLWRLFMSELGQHKTFTENDAPLRCTPAHGGITEYRRSPAR